MWVWNGQRTMIGRPCRMVIGIVRFMRWTGSKRLRREYREMQGRWRTTCYCNFD